MTVFAINVPARTARAFHTVAEAMNGATVGEKVIPSALALAQQPLYDTPELHRFLDAMNGGERRLFVDKAGVARAIFEGLRGLASPNPTPGSIVFRGEAARAPEPDEDAGDWLTPETAEMEEPDPAAELAERLAVTAAVIVAHARDILARVAHYRELAARHDADGHEALRVAAAERELAKLLSRLADNGTADMERARFAAEGVAFLETVVPSVLARHADQQPRPALEAKPYKGRKEGETRGRRGKMEGKRFTALRKMNLFGSGTRRRAAYQLILDNPGSAYEWLVEAGVYPADLAIFLRDGVARMDD